MFDLTKRNADLFDKIFQTFTDAFNRTDFPILRSNLNHFSTDIIEKDNAYHIQAELPGFNKEDITIEVEDHHLIIKAKREESIEEKNDKDFYIRRERHYGSFVRQFYLDNVDKDKIQAKLENGVLHIVLPKLQIDNPNRKRIEIE